MTKELEKYLGATYINSYQTAIMTETLSTLPNQEIPAIIPDTGVDRPRTDKKMKPPKKKNIDKSICQKRRNIDVYETNMYNI